MDFNKGLDDLKQKGKEQWENNQDEYIEKGKDFINDKLGTKAEAGDKDMEAKATDDDTSKDRD